MYSSPTRWDNVLQFIKPFNQRLGERFEEVRRPLQKIAHVFCMRERFITLNLTPTFFELQLEYIIHRQQFLEALSWQGGGGHRHALLPWKPSRDAANEMDGELEVEVVVQLLKSLEKLCPSQVNMGRDLRIKRTFVMKDFDSSFAASVVIVTNIWLQFLGHE